MDEDHIVLTSQLWPTFCSNLPQTIKTWPGTDSFSWFLTPASNLGPTRESQICPQTHPQTGRAHCQLLLASIPQSKQTQMQQLTDEINTVSGSLPRNPRSRRTGWWIVATLTTARSKDIAFFIFKKDVFMYFFLHVCLCMLPTEVRRRSYLLEAEL